MAINFKTALGLHEHTLNIRAQRAEVLANNLANSDTPHFKSQDIDFKRALDMSLSNSRFDSEFNEREQDFDMASVLRYRIPEQPDTGDGNTVDTQKEQARFSENALQYQMTLNFLSNKFKGLKLAIKGE